VIHSKPIGGRLGLEAGNPDLHAVNLEAALAYVLKGASHQAASQFGLDRLEAGGRVIGKRFQSYLSPPETAGRSSRKTSGFHQRFQGIVCGVGEQPRFQLSRGV